MFDTSVADKLKAEAEKAKKEQLIKNAVTIGGGAVGVIALALILISVYNKKKRENELDDEFNDEFDDVGDMLMAEEIINKAIAEAENADVAKSFLDGNINTHPLEEEIRDFASKHPEQTTELIKIWLNE